MTRIKCIEHTELSTYWGELMRVEIRVHERSRGQTNDKAAGTQDDPKTRNRKDITSRWGGAERGSLRCVTRQRAG